MLNKIQEFLRRKDEYDDASKDVIESWVYRAKDLESLDEMKKTEGWKMLEIKLRKDLHEHITDKLKDDERVSTLISLIRISDTKSSRARLEEEIDSFLGE